MIKSFFKLVVVLFVAFLFSVALKSPHYQIQRSMEISASPEAIFPYIASVKKADEWMPWNELDPSIKITYTAHEEGVGAASSWESTGQMGVGRAEIVAAVPSREIQTKITYLKPMEFEQLSTFKLEPKGDTTVMTWSVTGENSFIGRLMCSLTLMDMDAYVGGQFEKGMAKLKSIIEKR